MWYSFRKKYCDKGRQMFRTRHFRRVICRAKMFRFLLLAGSLWMLAPLPLPAWMGDGVTVGDLVVNPFVEGLITSDSNVNLTETNEIQDVFYNFTGGAQFHFGPQDFTVDGRGFFLLRRYDQMFERDFENWGERLAVKIGSTETASILIDQNYRLINDYDSSTLFAETLRPEAQNLSLTYDRSTRSRRTLSDAGIMARRDMTDKIQTDIGAAFSSERYATNALFSVRRLTGKGEASYGITEKTFIIANVEYVFEQNESCVDDATALIIRGGMKTRSTDKMSLRAAVGMERYHRPLTINEATVLRLQGAGVGNEEANLGKVDQALSFEASGKWMITEKITIEFAGHTAIQSVPQYPNTLDLVSAGSVSAVYATRENTISLALTGSYRRDDYLNPVWEQQQEWDRLDERLAGLIRLDYLPPRQFLSLYLEGGYGQATSTIPIYQCDQSRITAGFSLRY